MGMCRFFVFNVENIHGKRLLTGQNFRSQNPDRMLIVMIQIVTIGLLPNALRLYVNCGFYA
jgi:hypothetical protein